MSIFDDIGKVLGQAAPWIVKALPLPPPLGNLAATALGKVLGTDKTDPDSLNTALAGATADQLIKLKEADQAFQVQMQQMGFKQVTDLEKIYADDRSDARAREVALHDKSVPTLALLITVGFYTTLFWMMKWGVPDTSHDVVMVLIGTLGTAWVSVVTYYFGTSSGSADKSKTLDKIISNGKSNGSK